MRYINQHKIGIVLAVILGSIAALYLGSIAAQLYINYQQWLARGGMAGRATMDAIELRPQHAIAYAFTRDGVFGVLFVLAVSGGIFLFIKLHNKFSGKDTDDRNFARSGSGTYGTAGWMNEKEMNEVLEVTPARNARGTILGKTDKSVICLPTDTRLNQNIMIFGAPGTMKSRAFIRNQLLQSILREESVVLTDPKSELYADTAELFRKKGYTVKVFNLVQPEHSDSWNCMDSLSGNTLMAQVLTDTIITNTSEGRGDRFWDSGESNLLKALILYVDQDATRGPDAKHLPAVYQLITRNAEHQLAAMFAKLPINHPAKAPYMLFAQASDTVRTGIVLGLGTRLQVMQNESICKITSRSEIDLEEPAKSKCAYFIILSDQDSALDFLSSLFFAALFIKLVRFADSQPDGRCIIPVNIVLDELNNIGTIPDFSRRLSTVRSRLIQVCGAVQSLPQLQNRYPDNLWAELLGNADTQLMFGCTDELTAAYFSARSGDMTVEVTSTRTQRQTLAIAQLIPNYQHQVGDGRRRVLTPDEVLRLPNDELLIVLRGQKILRAKKSDFTAHPMASQMQNKRISEYIPQRHDENTPLPQTEPKNEQPRVLNLYGAAKPPDGF